jgi:ElaB/YqjD/DUF883 family membrane-anchored ribosome-binding protein
MDTPRERIKEQAEHVQELYHEGIEQAGELAQMASQRSRQALASTDHWVHENPWLALGIVAGAGLLLGILMAQSLREEW